jgi:hypothetical protein
LPLGCFFKFRNARRGAERVGLRQWAVGFHSLADQCYAENLVFFQAAPDHAQVARLENVQAQRLGWKQHHLKGKEWNDGWHTIIIPNNYKKIHHKTMRIGIFIQNPPLKTVPFA